MFTVFRFINYRSGLMAMSTTAAVSTTVSAVVTATVATASATASAFAGHHFNHFLNFFVCSRTALGNLAHESQIFTGQRMVHIHHYRIGFYFNYTTIQALAF
jgi:hypothetical protein